MQIVPHSKEAYNLMHQGMIAFSDIQQNGISIDIPYCLDQMDILEKEIQVQENLLYGYKEIKEWRKIYKSKFNLDSNDQLKDVLFERLEYEPVAFTGKINPKTGKETPKSDADSLKALGLGFTDDLLQYRKLIKVRSTYFTNIIKETQDGFMHPFLNLHTVRTYRGSSDGVNIQNQPNRDPEIGPRVRRAYRARKNHMLIEGDFGGVEVKGASWNCKDPTLLKYLRNPLTADMHADFMSDIFFLKNFDLKHDGDKTLRKGTKNGFTFPQFYGDYYGNNATSLFTWANLKGKRINPKDGLIISTGETIGKHLIEAGIKTYKQFENHIKDMERVLWEERFPVYAQWKEDTYEDYLNTGFLTSLTGFNFQGVMGKNDAVNYPIQSIAFHCLLWSIIRLNKLMKKKKMESKIIFQIHDSIMADVHKDEKDDYLEMLQKVMCHDVKAHWDWIITPLELEVDASKVNGNWSDTKTILKYIN